MTVVGYFSVNDYLLFVPQQWIAMLTETRPKG